MPPENIVIDIEVNAPMEKVWEYYTNPIHITQWNFADPSWHCPSASNDLKVGGKYFARMEAKDGSFGFDFEGIYTELIFGTKLTYQFADRFATVEFSENQSKTTVKLSFIPETEHPVDMQRHGWQSILNNFKSYTENNF